LLLLERNALPDIREVGRRMLPLAGVRIDPRQSSPFAAVYYHTMRLRTTIPGPDQPAPITVALPAGSKIAEVQWSHDSRHLFCLLQTDTGQQLWRLAADAPEQLQLCTDRINTVLMKPRWAPDGQQILCLLNRPDRGAEPKPPAVPKGPNVQESSGKTSPVRTYQDLLHNPYDEALWAYYTETQITLVRPDGSLHPIGSPGWIVDAELSPDGWYLLVETLEAPFSYLLPQWGFPRRFEVWDFEGKVVRTLAKVPMAENIPIGGVRTTPREVQWMASRNASLLWVEALDGGDPRVEAPYRDRLMMLEAPFEGDALEVRKLVQRFMGVQYFSDAKRLVTSEYDRDRRWVRALLHDLDQEPGTEQVLEDRSIRDRYGDPGDLVTTLDPMGGRVVLQEGDALFRIGLGASEEGDLPFVDRYTIGTRRTDRLWRCTAGGYERPVEVWIAGDGRKPSLLTAFENRTSPPNMRLRDLDTNTIQELTNFPDPTPQIRGIKKQLLRYERSDGVFLSGTLYLPADYQEGTRLPLLIWAYPQEFNDAATAAQVAGNEDRFTRMTGSTHLALVTQGYAVLDGATMPVIGDAETMNDTFLDQVVASAQAAIDAVVELGVADRNRVAVGGHSYGAFMTANLLAHCDLFRAGIARSGAYNRTLTPFGFQSERRPLWQAKPVYVNISPFFFAEQIQEPLLLIHGEEDNNSGTFPMQSERMFQAIQGNGGTVRLCMLPKESHGYRARQSVLQVQAEMLNWLDRYVKPIQ